MQSMTSAQSTLDQGIPVDEVSLPGAPINLSATVLEVGGAAIHLTWTNAPGAESYEVWRGVAADFAQAEQTATNINTSLRYDDDLALAGVEYHYWVRGSNSAGYGPFAGPVTGVQTNCLWSKAIGLVINAPVATGDGTVYIRDYYSGPSTFCAFNKDGSLLWTFQDTTYLGASPVISADGRLTYCVDEAGIIRSLDSAGRVLWTNHLRADAFSLSPAQDSYGTTYFTFDYGKNSSSPKMIAVSADGVILWSASWKSNTQFPQDHAVITSDGTVYLSGKIGLLSFQTDGRKRWQYPVPSASQAPPYLSTPSLNANDELISIANRTSAGTSLIRISSDGTLLSSDKVPSSSLLMCQETVIDRHGNMYYTRSRSLCCISPSGALIWTNAVTAVSFYDLTSVPAVDRLGNCYFVSNKAILAFDRNGRLVASWEMNRSAVTPPILTECGRLYIATEGRLYAFQALAGLDTEAPWQMYRHDSRGTSSHHTKLYPPEKPVLASPQIPFVNKVRLSIDTPYFPAALELFRSTNANLADAIKVAEGPSGQPFVDDTNAVPGIGCYYWVRATNAAGASELSGPEFLTAVSAPTQWCINLPGAMAAPPAVGPSGTIYTSTGDALTAINPNGTFSWQRPGITNVQTVAPDGSILARSGNALLSLSPTGVTNWILDNIPASQGTPAVAADNTLILSGFGQRLMAVASGGDIVWTNEIAYASTPSLRADGSIMFFAASANIVSLSPGGSLNSAASIANARPGTFQPILASDGTFYSISQWPRSYLTAFNSDGSSRWRLNSGDAQLMQPVLGKNGVIITAISATNEQYTAEGRAPYTIPQITAVNADGSIRWGFITESFPSVPVIASDGTMVIGAGRFLYALAVDDGRLLWQLDSPTGEAFGNLVLTADGVLYAPMKNGLLALQLNSGLADTPWPMYRQNARLSACQARPIPPQASLVKNSSGAIKLNVAAPGSGVILASDDLLHWHRFGWQPVTNQSAAWPVGKDKPRQFFRVISP